MNNKDDSQQSGVWMDLGEITGASKITRPDEDLPWVLDPDRMENWSDETLYNLEKSFREWLFKCIEKPSWKTIGKGKWNQGYKQTYDVIRKQFNIEPKDYQMMARLTKLCKHYATKVRATDSAIMVNRKKHSKIGYYLPKRVEQVKLPFSLRMRFEMLSEQGVTVTLRQLHLRSNAKSGRTLAELNNIRRLQNAKQREYWKRERERQARDGDRDASDDRTDVLE